MAGLNEGDDSRFEPSSQSAQRCSGVQPSRTVGRRAREQATYPLHLWARRHPGPVRSGHAHSARPVTTFGPPQHRAACRAHQSALAAFGVGIPARRQRAAAPVAHGPVRIGDQAIHRAYHETLLTVVAQERVYLVGDREGTALGDGPLWTRGFAGAAAEALLDVYLERHVSPR